MKKTIFTLLVVFGSFGAFAQFEQGTMLVGGDFGLEFTTQKAKGNGQTSTLGKSSEFSFNPDFGYFVIDNLAVGANLGLSLTSYKSDGSAYKYTTNSLTVGPFVRYYFPVKIFLQGNLGIGTMKSKDDNNGDIDENKYSVFGTSLGAGYALMLNDNVAIEPLIGYQSISQKDKSTGAPDGKYVDSGIFVRVGFQIYLR
jgi:outer membrane protein